MENVNKISSKCNEILRMDRVLSNQTLTRKNENAFHTVPRREENLLFTAFNRSAMLRRKAVLYSIGAPVAYVGLGAALVKGYNSLSVAHQQSVPSWLVGTVRFYEANYRVWRCTKAGGYLLIDYLNTTRKYNAQFPEGTDRITAKQFYHPTYQRGANQVLSTLEDLGGVFIKVGQELSMMKGILPSEYTDTLSALQDKVISLSPVHLSEIFKVSLNRFRAFPTRKCVE